MTHRFLAATLFLAACLDSPVEENGLTEDFATTGLGGSTSCRQSGTVVHGTTVNPAGEYWTGFAVHQIPNDMTINAPITIGACAVVQIGANKTITVAAGGSIVNQVDSFGNGMTFTRLDPTAPWTQIKLNGGSMSLTKVVIGGGGKELTFSLPGMVVLQSPNSTLTAQNVSLVGSASFGLNYTSGSFGTITGLGISASAKAPIFASADLVHNLPGGGYTGNTTDAIVIPAFGNHVVSHSQTWRNLGVPYQIGDGISGGTLDVDNGGTGAVAVLTLQPGTTLQFASGNAMRISTLASSAPFQPARGALVAHGTSTAPIVFTSAAPSPKPGDWDSLIFNDIVDPATSIRFAFVMFGGSNTGFKASCSAPDVTSTTAALVHILGPEPRDVDNNPNEFIQTTAFAHSLHMGIDRGWNSDDPVDFTATNTFVDIEGTCDETLPRRASDNGCASTCM
jgi:hypothetical protein